MPSEIKAAFGMWKAGGVSIWQVKAKTGFSARVLVPLFEKLLGKKINSPAMRLPAKSAKPAKEELQSSRRAA